MSVVHVILTGGVGSRLWPLSRKSKPKQYLPIFEKECLFFKTIHRNRAFCDEMIVVGNRSNVELTEAELQKLAITDYHHVVESVPRNTTAAIAFAALKADPEDVLLITPSDHLIESEDHYRRCITRGVELAQEGYLVTFGVKPKSAETGYGYIETDGEEVVSFREKPDRDTAISFLEKGTFLWNSGIFCFKASTFLSELEAHMPGFISGCKAVLEKSGENYLDESLSLLIPSISVDYAIMEKSKNIKIVNADFVWSDMGSFEALVDYYVSKGHQMDSNGNLLIGSDKLSKFVGLEDTLVVDTEDAILILKISEAQAVKNVFEDLERENSPFIN